MLKRNKSWIESSDVMWASQPWSATDLGWKQHILFGLQTSKQNNANDANEYWNKLITKISKNYMNQAQRIEIHSKIIRTIIILQKQDNNEVYHYGTILQRDR